MSHDAVADDAGHKVFGNSSSLTLSGDTTINYAENGEGSVATYTLSGSDGSITWSLSGDDSDDFSLAGESATRRELSFTSSPNYEGPTDADTDNQYDVTIQASDGTNTSTLQVTVFVTNVLHDADELPVITGTARVGETLTVDTSPIPDTDQDTTFGYQWIRTDGGTDTNIDGANSSSYTLTDDDEGKTIKVRVTFTDDDGNEETLTSSATPTPTATATPGDTPSANLRAAWTYSPWPQTEGRPISVRVSLNWDTPDGYGITNYVAQMYEPNGDEFGLPLTGATIVGETQLLGSGELWIQPDTAYEYVLTLRNAANETIVAEDVTVIVHSTAENPATEAPTNLKASLASDGSSVVLSWDAPEGNLWRYEVIRDWRLNGSVAATQNYLVNKKYTTYTDTNIGASSGRTYEYRVRAVTGFYTSYDSEVVSIQIPSPSSASSDATLGSLTLSGIAFGTFASGTYSYSTQVGNSVSQTTVTPTVNDSGATYVIKLGGVTDADGVIALSVGSNVITVEVTAEDGIATRTYTVTVTRAAPPSTDATLSALTLSGIDFGTFASGTTSYTAQVANSVSQTTVTPTVNHSGASYVIKLGGVTDADGVIALSEGSNVITIEVTAEDDSTTRTLHRNRHTGCGLDGRNAQRPDTKRHQLRHLRVKHDLIHRAGSEQRVADYS